MLGNPINLGRIVGQGSSLALSAQDRSMHLHVSGATGTGKSKFLESLIRQDILNWHRSKSGLLLLDPHGSLYDSIMKWLAATRLDRPIVPIDLRRDDWVVSYNLLRKRNANPSVIVANIVDAMAYVWGQSGTDTTPLFARWASNTLRALYDKGHTLVEAMHLINAKSLYLRKAMTEGLSDQMSEDDWTFANALNAKDFENQIGSTLNRLGRFLRNELLRAIFGQVDVSLDLSNALEQGQIVLVSLATERARVSREDAKAIAAEFGVKEHYVRQRMKLAALAEVVKDAYRKGEIDTATAEAFSSVPEERQVEVWKEMNGHPRNAEQVRNVIANSWIDSSLALFDIANLPESSVSKDLFSERVFIERQVFMELQAQALEAERQKLLDDGWKEIVTGGRDDVRDRLLSMNAVEREFDPETSKKLTKVATRRDKLEELAEKVEQGTSQFQRIERRYEALEAQADEIMQQAPAYTSEETKAVATIFLVLDPDGKVHREYRLPHRIHHASDGEGHGGSQQAEAVKPPTSDDLSDKQLGATFTHQALMVREALLANPKARKRILALMLHDKVRSEGLAIRHEANGTTLHAMMSEEFKSVAWDRLKEKRAKVDPFVDEHNIEDRKAYERLGKLSDAMVDSLIEILTVNLITAHLQRRTDLVHHLARELKVNVRDEWQPDETWLSSFQKIQLAHLLTELKGAMYAPAPEKKKSELVKELTTLFADAAEGKLEDKQVADRLNSWLPSNLREVKNEAKKQRRSVATKQT